MYNVNDALINWVGFVATPDECESSLLDGSAGGWGNCLIWTGMEFTISHKTLFRDFYFLHTECQNHFKINQNSTNGDYLCWPYKLVHSEMGLLNFFVSRLKAKPSQAWMWPKYWLTKVKFAKMREKVLSEFWVHNFPSKMLIFCAHKLGDNCTIQRWLKSCISIFRSSIYRQFSCRCRISLNYSFALSK